ncbi:sodium:solute symporter family protein [Roseofilum capinflatum]|uniref:Na+:solute symporter n=1 Tax=Roseofilum capinflatum BLCC-M114 TaxID=3022440 RepID=A0ABT7BBE2_9CYAN|nr:sodium:solute symporter family protein [Roseofilum capinflatum]MDJ1176137.1 Na+:solute symporter [Roseofilum capinflatum BLCC-M114]
MALIDWLIVLLYLVLTLGLGLYLSGKASEGLEAFFVSGRSLPWWLSGTSMAATTFSIDTPLYIAGVVASRGIAGNWEWWSFGIAHVVMIYIFARMWRRSGVVTDAQLTEIRYGGSMAAILRAVKAFLFAVPINCIGIGYAMLAMVKVIDALELWQSLGIEPGENLKLWSVVGVSLFVLFYAGISGLWGVVATDFFQFFLGLFGAIAVAVIAVSHIGGIHELIPLLQERTDTDILAFIPLNGEAASLSLSTFGAYLLIQWWAFRRSDGGGEFIQRLLASKDEAEAEKAAWFFNILHYVIRTWPWILVALVALVIYPNLEDPELGYPKLMLDFLPPALLGVVVASLLAAFMSTVSTSINWGASYLTNDLYLRFFRPESSQSELVLVGRVSSIMVTVLGAIAAFYSQDVATVFRLVIAIGTGPGLVLILRWFWWRINAAAELASMVGGFVVGLTTSVVPVLTIEDFGLRLLVTAGISGVCWVAAMLLTPPESDRTLDEFYRLVRPGGPGWRKVRSRTGLPPAQSLPQDLLKVTAASLILFGAMFAVGGFLLLNQRVGWISLIIAVAGAMMLRYVSQLRIAPMARPGLKDE